MQLLHRTPQGLLTLFVSRQILSSEGMFMQQKAQSESCTCMSPSRFCQVRHAHVQESTKGQAKVVSGEGDAWVFEPKCLPLSLIDAGRYFSAYIVFPFTYKGSGKRRSLIQNERSMHAKWPHALRQGALGGKHCT